MNPEVKTFATISNNIIVQNFHNSNLSSLDILIRKLKSLINIINKHINFKK